MSTDDALTPLDVMVIVALSGGPGGGTGGGAGVGVGAGV
jgi:hypothetical protein